MDLDEIKLNWQRRFSDFTGNKKDKKRPSYLHFDVKPNFRNATKQIFDTSYVVRHSFLPFVFFESRTEKIKKIEKLAEQFKYPDYKVSSSKPDLPERFKNRAKHDHTVANLLISKKGRPHKFSTWKLRPICYASHFDSLLYSYYGAILSNLYESLLDEHGLSNEVLAFRPTRDNEKVSNITHAGNAFSFIEHASPCVVLAFDVSSFFDILDHKILRKKWIQVLGYENKNTTTLSDHHYSIFKSLTRYSYVDINEVYKQFGISATNPKGVSSSIHKQMSMGLLPVEKRPVLTKQLKKPGRKERTRICSPEGFRKHVAPLIKRNTDRGIPQGSPVSGLLSNIYMIDFDQAAKSFADERDGIYMRYCDDLLCIIPLKDKKSPKELAKEIQNFIFNLANEYKLDVNDDKTDKFFFDYNYGRRELNCSKIQGNSFKPSWLQYLGFNFDGKRVSIRASSIMRYKKKMKRGINYHLRLRYKHDPFRKLKTQSLRRLYDHAGRGASNFPSYARRAHNQLDNSIVNKQLKNRGAELSYQIRLIDSKIPKWIKEKNKKKSKHCRFF